MAEGCLWKKNLKVQQRHANQLDGVHVLKLKLRLASRLQNQTLSTAAEFSGARQHAGQKLAEEAKSADLEGQFDRAFTTISTATSPAQDNIDNAEAKLKVSAQK